MGFKGQGEDTESLIDDLKFSNLAIVREAKFCLVLCVYLIVWEVGCIWRVGR